MDRGRQPGPDAGTGVATRSHEDVRKENHENVRIGNFCLNRVVVFGATKYF